MDKQKVLAKLQQILEAELTAYLNYLSRAHSLVGYQDRPLAIYFKAEAEESCNHVARAAERIAALGGIPEFKVKFQRPAKPARAHALLQECAQTEAGAADMYKELKVLVGENDLQLARYAEDHILEELKSYDEIQQMLRQP